MSDTAYKTQYKDEWIASYEQNVSLLRSSTVTTEAVINGNQATFLIAGSGNATASTRGINGLIPARSDELSQKTATLVEADDLVRRSHFNIFASQGDQKQIMQKTTLGTINRKIDSQIITILNTGTVAIGSASLIPSPGLVQNAIVKLGNASVPWDSHVTLLLQPSFLSFLEEAPEFSSADYVSMGPYNGGDLSWRDKPMTYRWRNMLVLSHPNLPGKATASEKSFMYHKCAIGHAANSEGLDATVGYDEEQDYSWARATMFMGGVLLQNTGIVVMTTDGTARG